MYETVYASVKNKGATKVMCTTNLTQQSRHWNEDSDGYTIQNQLLATCIGLGSSCNGAFNIRGFNAGKETGYALLAYIAQRAIGFYRMPFFEDRVYHNHRRCAKAAVDKLVSDIGETTINDAISELKTLYSHTQEKLSQAGLETVRLRRNVEIRQDSNYAYGLIQLARASKTLKRKEVSFEMDILNSFTDSISEYGHRADVVIEYEVPAEDVLYCSNLVNHEGRSRLVETREWVVMNRSSTGVVTLPVDALRYDSKHVQETSGLSVEHAQDFMERHSPFVYRRAEEGEPILGTYGLKHSLKKRVALWLLKDNPVVIEG